MENETTENGTTETERKASTEDLDILRNTARQLETLHNTVGAMEVEKSQLISNVIGTRSKMENKAKEIMIKSGIKEEDLPKYKISLENGEIISV